MSSDLIERHLAGESSSRTVFGRSGGKKARTRGYVASAVLLAVFAMFVEAWIGMVLGVLGAVATFLLTLQTGPGANRWGEVQTGLRARELAKTSRDRFNPVRDRPAELDQAVTAGTKKERKAAMTQWNTYRDQHNAADGLTWLRAIRDLPGIAWHAPIGEESYLSVVFPIEGQIRGLESDRRLSSFARSFGDAAAAHGDMKSHAKRFQMITRMLPVDTARHEAWVLKNVQRTRSVPTDVLVSYADVVADEVLSSYQGMTPQERELTSSYAQVVNGLRASSGGLGQRHFVVVRWPLTPRLLAAGERRGAGVVGLIRVMDAEINAAYRRLSEAGLKPGVPLTAAQVAAMMRHQQCPEWPIDYAGDLRPSNPDPWLAEDGSARDHSIVTCQVPSEVTGEAGSDTRTSTWWHASARVPIEEVETGPRGPLWMLPLLTAMHDPVVRTIAIEFETVPASQARKQAREDLTVDLADIQSQQKKGRLLGDDLEAAKKAAMARVEDLRPGSGHHGGFWCMHLTISAPSRDELIDAMDRVEEAAENCAISALEWLQGYGVAHHAVTWPLARAMQAPKSNATEKVRTLMAGKGRKDALR